MKISQREAQRLRKQIKAYEAVEVDRRRAWSAQWPGGVDVGRVEKAFGLHPHLYSAVETARKLGHYVVVSVTSGDILFHAVKP